MRTLSRTSDGSFDEFVCFNTILEIVCSSDELIVFDSARYGRNHSLVAAQCDVPFTRNCDIDVHFSLNRACAGKTRCSMAVNTAFFGDPCGYEEFLRVVYRCVLGISYTICVILITSRQPLFWICITYLPVESAFCQSVHSPLGSPHPARIGSAENTGVEKAGVENAGAILVIFCVL